METSAPLRRDIYLLYWYFLREPSFTNRLDLKKKIDFCCGIMTSNKNDNIGDGSSNHGDDNHEDSSSSSSILTSTENTGHQTDQSSTSSFSLARAESRMVQRSKMLVFLAIAFAAAGCGIATYFFTKASEEEIFRRQVRDVDLLPFFDAPLRSSLTVFSIYCRCCHLHAPVH